MGYTTTSKYHGQFFWASNYDEQRYYIFVQKSYGPHVLPLCQYRHFQMESQRGWRKRNMTGSRSIYRQEDLIRIMARLRDLSGEDRLDRHFWSQSVLRRFLIQVMPALDVTHLSNFSIGTCEKMYHEGHGDVTSPALSFQWQSFELYKAPIEQGFVPFRKFIQWDSLRKLGSFLQRVCVFLGRGFQREMIDRVSLSPESTTNLQTLRLRLSFPPSTDLPPAFPRHKKFLSCSLACILQENLTCGSSVILRRTKASGSVSLIDNFQRPRLFDVDILTRDRCVSYVCIFSNPLRSRVLCKIGLGRGVDYAKRLGGSYGSHFTAPNRLAAKTVEYLVHAFLFSRKYHLPVARSAYKHGGCSEFFFAPLKVVYNVFKAVVSIVASLSRSDLIAIVDRLRVDQSFVFHALHENHCNPKTIKVDSCTFESFRVRANNVLLENLNY